MQEGLKPSLQTPSSYFNPSSPIRPLPSSFYGPYEGVRRRDGAMMVEEQGNRRGRIRGGNIRRSGKGMGSGGVNW